MVKHQFKKSVKISWNDKSFRFHSNRKKPFYSLCYKSTSFRACLFENLKNVWKKWCTMPGTWELNFLTTSCPTMSLLRNAGSFRTWNPPEEDSVTWTSVNWLAQCENSISPPNHKTLHLFTLPIRSIIFLKSLSSSKLWFFLMS